MKAITTVYKGWRFRSRTEARWAVFFDALGIKWEYEPEGFEMSDGTRYLPDFWLPDWGMWVEVKGGFPTEREKLLADRLHCEVDFRGWGVGRPVFITHGAPGEKNVGTLLWAYFSLFDEVAPGRESTGFPLWGDTNSDGMTFVEVGVPPGSSNGVGVRVLHSPRATVGPRVGCAVETSRGARFEWGESGGVL